jgi:carboxyl-terminal processing protease
MLAVSFACYLRADHTPFSRHLADAYRSINRLALEDPPDRALFDSAVEGMVAELNRRGDIHSEYITAAEAAEFDAEITQEFGGIGVVITLRGDKPPRELVVVSPPEPGQPAAGHDIRARDRILAIDGVPVSEMDTQTTDEVIYHMRGPVGEPVRLTILHAGETVPVEIEVVRDLIAMESVKGVRKRDDASWQFRLDDYPQVAYVRITTFGEKTPDELYDVLERLTSEGVQGVVLDLRENPGGELNRTVQVCDMFLREGKTIVQTRDRYERLEENRRSTDDTPFPDVPLAVLINRGSASASEILAACLQDHERAVVIGERSFGKGTVQRLLPVGPPVRRHEDLQSGILKLTMSSYWRPSGKNIHRMPGDGEEDEWGVAPDPGMEVKLTPHEYQGFLLDMHRREIYNPHGDALIDDLEDVPAEVKALLPFDDEALAKAVDYLKGAGRS